MDSFSLILDYNNIDKRTNDRLELQKIVASRSGWTLSRFPPPNFLLFFLLFPFSFDGEEEASCDALRALERLYSFLWMKRQLGRHNTDNFSPVEKIFARYFLLNSLRSEVTVPVVAKAYKLLHVRPLRKVVNRVDFFNIFLSHRPRTI